MNHVTSPDTSDSAIEREIQAKGLTAPRVTKAEFDANIKDVEIVKHVSRGGQVLRWAVLTTASGFAVVGRPSVAVSPENDDAEIGVSVATANAKEELWPLMGYALKERLAATPADFRDRVRAEAAALAENVEKLGAFLAGSSFKTIPDEEQLALADQHHYMQSYLRVLTDRISRF